VDIESAVITPTAGSRASGINPPPTPPMRHFFYLLNNTITTQYHQHDLVELMITQSRLDPVPVRTDNSSPPKHG
jgi:hypothetical protein